MISIDEAFHVEPRDAQFTIREFAFDLNRTERTSYICACGASLVIRCGIQLEGRVSCDRCSVTLHAAVEA